MNSSLSSLNPSLHFPPFRLWRPRFLIYTQIFMPALRYFALKGRLAAFETLNGIAHSCSFSWICANDKGPGFTAYKQKDTSISMVIFVSSIATITYGYWDLNIHREVCSKLGHVTRVWYKVSVFWPRSWGSRVLFVFNYTFFFIFFSF